MGNGTRLRYGAHRRIVLLQICNVLCRNESKAFGATKVHVVAIQKYHRSTPTCKQVYGRRAVSECVLVLLRAVLVKWWVHTFLLTHALPFCLP